ncbi:hypothetical protein BT63DRAFT_425669 [Microthyrium microscopicum]|uniref:Uncharacterized protein n=1 Tax=Microthyrium microscopicum TaxID=703497 RepID=A0A6A6UA74_9PEZI|nr:hypothetical protein BT63DRAFT_425669 [Microthyrium microscopicum]
MREFGEARKVRLSSSSSKHCLQTQNRDSENRTPFISINPTSYNSNFNKNSSKNYLTMLQFALHVAQIGLSAYALYHASISIPNLQKWEKSSERAAKVSKSAERDLKMTRQTQAAGAVGAALSLLFASALALHLVSSGFKSLSTNVFGALMTAAASVYIGGHWDAKGNIPLVTSYNDALRSTQTIRGQLALVGVVWALSSVVELYSLLFGK